MAEGFISFQMGPLVFWIIGGYILWCIFFYLGAMKYCDMKIKESEQEREKTERVDK